MFYAIRHFTRYRYSNPVWESVMELRMHPRSDNSQRCFTFQLSISPRARIFSYAGHLGNLVHHFDIPERHTQLTVIADALVDVDEPAELPQSLGSNAWLPPFWRCWPFSLSAKSNIGRAVSISGCMLVQ